MNFIDQLLASTSHSRSPEIFRRWTAISMLASTMGRSCHTTISEADGPIYPNMFIVLVGEPGSGKTLAVESGARLLRQVPDINMGPDKITPEALLRKLADRTKQTGTSIMAVYADELNLFLQRKGELDVKPLFAGLYNCPVRYEYSTQAHGDQVFENACINICSTTQPVWIAENFTMNDLGQGFPSRLFLIYSAEVRKASYFTTYSNASNLSSALVSHLKVVSLIKGTFTWAGDAQAFFTKVTSENIPPTPTFPALTHYNSRRDLHLAKLCMIYARARKPDARQIEVNDVQAAMAAMLEAERYMPSALDHVGGNQYTSAQSHLLQFMARQSVEKGRHHLTFQELHRFISHLLTPVEVKPFLENIINQGICTKNGENPVTATYIFSKKELAEYIEIERKNAEANNAIH